MVVVLPARFGFFGLFVIAATVGIITRELGWW